MTDGKRETREDGSKRPGARGPLRALLLVCFAAAGCASAPPVKEGPPPPPACEVWTEGLFGKASTRVTGGVARIKGLFGEQDGAYYQSPGQIAMHGAFGDSTVATFQSHQLTLKGLFGDQSIPVGAHTAHLSGPLGDTDFQYSPLCSDADAALGVVTLVAASQAAH